MARRNRSFFFNNKTGELKSDGKVVVDATNTTNILQTKGSTTGNAVAVNAVGDDTNIDIRITPKGSGNVEVLGTLEILTGKRIIDSAGTKVEFGDDIDMNSNKISEVGTPTASTDAATKGYVDTYYLPLTGGTISSNLIISGDLTVSGTTTTVNSETVSLADNILELNSNASGAPSENAGITVNRGSSADVTLRWNETNDKWELTTDGSSYANIAVTSDISLSTLSVTATASELNILDGVTATASELNILDGVTATASELNILDGVTATTAEINYLDGVTSSIQTQIDNISSSFTLAADSGTNDTFTTGQTLTIAGGTGIDTTVSDNQISIAIDSTVATLTGTQTLTNKTLTAPIISSINNTGTLTLPTNTGTVALTSDITLSTLSVTATASELNILDGVTATANELNILDGVTATTAELNYSDGVTSNIQTQLDAKLALAGGTMSGAIAMGTNKITGMGDPTAAQDAATKAYVDSQVSSVPTGDITAVNITAGTGLSGTVTTASGDHTQTLSIDSTVATLTGSQTLTNKTLTAPVISSITNTGTLTLPTSTGTVALTSDITLSTLSVTATASELNILDGVTATTAELNYSDGVTSNIQTQLDTKASLTGSETLTNKTLTSPQVNTNIDLLAQADVRFYDSDSSNYVGFQSPATVTGNILWTLPSSDGTEGQVLSTNGGGTLSWEDPSSGGGSGSSYPNSTFSTVPGTNGNFDMSYNVAQTTQETPFEASGTDAFGVNLGSVFSLMDPIGSLESIDYGDGEAYVGA